MADGNHMRQAEIDRGFAWRWVFWIGVVVIVALVFG